MNFKGIHCNRMKSNEMPLNQTKSTENLQNLVTIKYEFSANIDRRRYWIRSKWSQPFILPPSTYFKRFVTPGNKTRYQKTYLIFFFFIEKTW